MSWNFSSIKGVFAWEKSSYEAVKNLELIEFSLLAFNSVK